MPTMDVSDDEAALLMQMREWRDGIPADAIGHGKESAVYIALISARAQMVVDALNHHINDYQERSERLHGLLSPHLILRLCQNWHDVQDYIRRDEAADADI